jgi:formylglycine-generating enzyme required for sulfatase activity
MGEQFDPYHRWLGISPKDQPPTHYRLLAIDLFETDVEVIRDAAERQMAHVRTYQLGKHSALSQRILNELGAAKACLLDSKKKAAYDKQLNDTLAARSGDDSQSRATTDALSGEPADQGLAKLLQEAGISEPIAAPVWQPPRRKTKSAGKPWLILGAGVAAVVVLVGVVGLLSSKRNPPPTGAKDVASSGDAKASSAQGRPQGQNDAPSREAAGAVPADGEPLPKGKGTEPPRAAAPFDAAKAKEYQRLWADYLGVPVEFTNTIGMKFVLIPPGEFDMGSTQEEIVRFQNQAKEWDLPQWVVERSLSEAPRHRIRLTQAFYLGKYEVTQAQYQQVMGSNPSKFPGSGPDAPVETVSWNDAVSFCQRLSALPAEKGTGGVCRLPTEAEWEYAARAGTTTAYCFGDEEAALSDYAWWGGNSDGKTHPVGEKRPNGFLLFDMHGNVWEWCADWDSAEYYAKSPTDDPVGPDFGSVRAIRGGSFDARHTFPGHYRSAFRNHGVPGLSFDYVGFRVVRTLTPRTATGELL